MFGGFTTPPYSVRVIITLSSSPGVRCTFTSWEIACRNHPVNWAIWQNTTDTLMVNHLQNDGVTEASANVSLS